jgi:hypothetical protein
MMAYADDKQQDHDDYAAAYAAWRIASESFEKRMRRVVRGEHVDAMQLALDATVLMRLHIDWLETALLLTTCKGDLLPLDLASERRPR